MYSGGWAFSNSRKNVNYPPYKRDQAQGVKMACFKAFLFGILQKPNKRQRRSRQAFGTGSGKPGSLKPSLCPVFPALFRRVQSVKGLFSVFAVLPSFPQNQINTFQPSTVHDPQQAKNAHNHKYNNVQKQAF